MSTTTHSSINQIPLIRITYLWKNKSEMYPGVSTKLNSHYYPKSNTTQIHITILLKHKTKTITQKITRKITQKITQKITTPPSTPKTKTPHTLNKYAVFVTTKSTRTNTSPFSSANTFTTATASKTGLSNRRTAPSAKSKSSSTTSILIKNRPIFHKPQILIDDCYTLLLFAKYLNINPSNT